MNSPQMSKPILKPYFLLDLKFPLGFSVILILENFLAEQGLKRSLSVLQVATHCSLFFTNIIYYYF